MISRSFPVPHIEGGIVVLEFTCGNCGENIQTDIDIDSPNTSAHNSSDSAVNNEGSANCPNCGKNYNIELTNEINELMVVIDELYEIEVTASYR